MKVMQHISDDGLMTSDVVADAPHDFGTRINELGNKSTQLLLFLTFALLGAATLMTRDGAAQERLVRAAAWWWMLPCSPFYSAYYLSRTSIGTTAGGTGSWFMRNACSCGRP